MWTKRKTLLSCLFSVTMLVLLFTTSSNVPTSRVLGTVTKNDADQNVVIESATDEIDSMTFPSKSPLVPTSSVISQPASGVTIPVSENKQESKNQNEVAKADAQGQITKNTETQNAGESETSSDTGTNITVAPSPTPVLTLPEISDGSTTQVTIEQNHGPVLVVVGGNGTVNSSNGAPQTGNMVEIVTGAALSPAP